MLMVDEPKKKRSVVELGGGGPTTGGFASGMRSSSGRLNSLASVVWISG